MNKVNLLVLVLLMPFLTYGGAAFAASRKIYFSAVSKNEAARGLQSAQTSKCVISITNTSLKDQSVVVSFDGSKSIGTVSNGPVTGGTANVTLAAMAPGSSGTAEYSFASFPAATVGTQTITCAGSIIVTDDIVTAPGFVSASGTLLGFYTVAEGETVAVGGSSYTDTATITRTPISINDGKPF